MSPMVQSVLTQDELIWTTVRIAINLIRLRLQTSKKSDQKDYLSFPFIIDAFLIFNLWTVVKLIPFLFLKGAGADTSYDLDCSSAHLHVNNICNNTSQ